MEVFIRQLEIALRTANIPQDKWKQHLLSQLTLQTKEQVIGLLEDETSDFDDIKRALLGCTAIIFAAAAEAIFTADKVTFSTYSTITTGRRQTSEVD